MASFRNKNKKNANNIENKPITIAAIIVIIAAMLFCAFTNDLGGREALKWLLAVLAVSVLLRPYLPIDNFSLWDNGFSLSFGIGFALSFFGAWFVSALGIARFSTGLCFLSIAVLVCANFVYKKMSKKPLTVIGVHEVERYIWGYALFAALFVCAFWVIGFNPSVDSSTENFMDYGFMESIYRQKAVAPYDIWMSGYRLNYYYLGQAAAVFMCRIAGTRPEYGYNLMLCTFWAMTFCMSSVIGSSVVKEIARHNRANITEKTCRIATVASGTVSGFMSAIAGNGHWLVYGIIIPAYQKITGNIIVEGNYWFPNATVYISKDLGDIDCGKTEFPAYSAVLGDLHAHVCNVMFVIPFIALLLDYAFSKKDKKSYIKLLLCALLLGLYKGINFWDFAIYYVICGGVVVLCDLSEHGINIKSIRDVVIKAVGITAISYVAILPFTLHFQKIASKLMIAQNHTTFYKMLVLWSVPFAITFSLIAMMYADRKEKVIYPQTSKIGLLAICLCAMGLVIAPEIVYIEDIYGEDNARFNTMFKLTYQAFIIFGIIAGITVGIAILKATRKTYILAVAIIVVTVLLSAYTPHSVKDWMGDITDADNRWGISAIEPLYQQEGYKYEVLAREALEEDDREVINIIECAGDSYTHESALSVISGTCTVAGWYVHEWLWRDDVDLVAQKHNEVRNFYELGSVAFCKDIIDKYDIDYIWVGPAEINKYSINPTGYTELCREILSINEDGRDIKLLQVIK